MLGMVSALWGGGEGDICPKRREGRQRLLAVGEQVWEYLLEEAMGGGGPPYPAPRAIKGSQ